MEKDLKAQNVRPLTVMYVGTLLLVAAVHWGVEEVFKFSVKLGEQALIVAAITAFGGMLSNFLPNHVKHPLVYWRFRNVLSGHRCRSICQKDPRLLPRDLERKWPKLFLDDMKEKEQNAYWYKEIYRPVRNAPEVLQAHRSFLLFRDAGAGLFLLLIGLLLWKAIGMAVQVQSISIWSATILAGIFVLVSQAARQSGNRMVVNAVAVALEVSESSEKA